VLRGGHEPCTRVAGDACGRPLFQRRDERILRELFGGANVANDSRESGDDPG